MQQELDEKLCRDFPIIYRDRYEDFTKTCMCWGFECGDGWFSIIYDLSAKLEEIARKQPEPKKHGLIKVFVWTYIMWPAINYIRKNKINNEFVNRIFFGYLYDIFMPTEDFRLKVTQVKEKLGTLRVYVNDYSDYIDQIIDEAETKSEATCEECGNLGSLRKHGYWLVTLCEKHNKEKIKLHGKTQYV